jgi:hypothetical protein
VHARHAVAHPAGPLVGAGLWLVGMRRRVGSVRGDHL